MQLGRLLPFLLLPLARVQAQDSVPIAPPSGARVQGAIAGRVIDQASNAPIALTVVDIVGTPMAAQTDGEGRYRIASVPAGFHRVRARRIGYAPVIADSVHVTADEATTQDFTLASAAARLASVEIKGTVGTASDAAMIDQQKNAAAVIDGISAQAISRAPGANAAEAITRVTGITVMDKKFTIVRGLPERYSNTLLNNVELPSPEPLRRIVPLDIFPASLLESIVAAKTATPDRPGDFAGGSVEIKTKEFPDTRVFQFNISQDFNSVGTFRDASYVPRRGASWLGFGGDARARPVLPPAGQNSAEVMERFAESLRNVWTPRARSNPPGLGLGLTTGNRFGRDALLGYTLSLSYSSKVDLVPDRLYQFVSDDDAGTADRGFVARDNIAVVDWGAIANLAFQPARTQKFGWKNLYTRNAEEVISEQDAFDTHRGDERARVYQVRYVERDLIQTQLSGDHTLPFLFNSRVEWRATAARARRDEPDNRSATYMEDIGTGLFALSPSQQGLLWFRYLTDDVRTAQADYSVPIPMWGGRQLQVKSGGLYRQRDRDFKAQLFTFRPSPTPSSGFDVMALPPEHAFAPEHVGGPDADIALYRLDAGALPYRADDDLSAAYLMVDLPLLSRLRILGGARAEQWRLDIRPQSGVAALDSVTQRRALDILPSANVTLAVTDRMNVRLAAYKTLARPDPRELSNDYYTPVSGECSNAGNDKLRHTRIENADFRWEFYPDANELFALSAFYKSFSDPVIEVVSLPQANTCVVRYVNAESAINVGGELELRKSLGFLPLLPDELFAAMNLTLVRTEARLGELFANHTTTFMGQSPYVVNASLVYTSRDNRFTASAFAHAYGERISRYGGTLRDVDRITQIPHVKEASRVVVDAKVQGNVARHVTLSASAKNLLDAPQQYFQDSRAGRVPTGYQRTGTSLKLGLGYDW